VGASARFEASVGTSDDGQTHFMLLSANTTTSPTLVPTGRQPITTGVPFSALDVATGKILWQPVGPPTATQLQRFR